MPRTVDRRDVLKGTGALALTVAASPLSAQALAPVAVDDALIQAARKEGKIAYYTSVDLPLAQRIGKAFETKYPGISVRVERTGAERVFQRIGQEYASKIHAVDVVNSSDAAHMIVWKRDGLLAAYMTEDMARHYPAEHVDPDGMFASFRATLSVMARNTELVKADEAPKGFVDLLDPKWAGKIVKAHPSYSGTIMTATFQIARDLGWDYFEKLAKQRIMQVQSATDPPKKLGLGERAVMADGSEYIVFQMMDQKQPVAPIYAVEGTPLVIGPNAVFKAAPNPNAARLFQSYCFSIECQQLIVHFGGVRSFHRQIKERPDHIPLENIKLMKEDAAGVEKQSEEIKKRYSQIFKV